MSRESKILTAILVIVVGGLIAVFAIANQAVDENPPVDRATLIKADSHKEGSGSVELVEFGDYQCPACGNAFPYVQKIMKDYNGRVTMYFRNFPLADSHPNALIAANAAEAAADQGKFWDMNHLLYEKQTEWSPLANAQALDKFAEYAQTLGLDAAKIKEAAASQAKKDRISADRTDGETLGVNSTPTFYVNNRKVTGTGEQGLRDAIEAALKAKK